jgi:5-methylcytosine-specific restriction endonuclease McrA
MTVESLRDEFNTLVKSKKTVKILAHAPSEMLCHHEEMDQSQARRHRKWTTLDQVTAEVAAACGCSLYQIAKILHRTPIGVSYRLHAEKNCNRKESHAKWQSQNKEKISKAAKAWKENNKERKKQADKEWTRNNPEKVRERGRRRRARKCNAIQNAIITVTHEDVELLKEAFNQSCVYCGSKERLTIDHVIPLAKGGTHELKNLLPCCKSCNSSKNCSPIQSWYQSKSFFSEQKWDAIVKFHPWLGIS